jgi:CMP-N-acetylneuraminic acid synthetase
MKAERMLAVIPAKGASTRLPRKNVRPLGGKPLLGWTIEAAVESGVFDAIIVSSEDDEILDIAARWPVETRRRPARLAVDPAGCIRVAQHVYAELESEGRRYAHITILMPTCPFRNAEDIRAAAAIRRGVAGGVVISASEFSHTPFNALIKNAAGYLEPLMPERFGRKTQELPVAYRPNGAIFMMEEEVLKVAKNLYPEPMRPYVMPAERSVDIDNELDLEFAEFLWRR